MTKPEKSASPWRGETGHIDYAMLKRYGVDLKSSVYYIAGLPKMVDTMKTLLAASGVSEDDIHAEEFTGFTMGDHDLVGTMI